MMSRQMSRCFVNFWKNYESSLTIILKEIISVKDRIVRVQYIRYSSDWDLRYWSISKDMQPQRFTPYKKKSLRGSSTNGKPVGIYVEICVDIKED